MTDPSDGNVDAADLPDKPAPAGWSPEVTDDDPNPRDVRDRDEDADA